MVRDGEEVAGAVTPACSAQDATADDEGGGAGEQACRARPECRRAAGRVAERRRGSSTWSCASRPQPFLPVGVSVRLRAAAEPTNARLVIVGALASLGSRHARYLCCWHFAGQSPSDAFRAR